MDDIPVVEWVDQWQSLGDRQSLSNLFAVVVRDAFGHDGASVGSDSRDLRWGDAFRDDDGGSESGGSRSIGEGLSMVSRAVGDDTRNPELAFDEAQHGIERASGLKGARDLQ